MKRKKISVITFKSDGRKSMFERVYPGGGERPYTVITIQSDRFVIEGANNGAAPPLNP